MEYKIKIEENTISYIRKSNNNNKVAFLIHGFSSDKNEKGNFIKLSDELLTNGIDSIAVDLIGHGDSSGNSEDLTFSKGIKIIETILTLYDYEKIYFVGSSYGGTLSLLYLENHNIDKIVLWSPLLDLENNILKPSNHFTWEFLGEEALKNIEKDGYSIFGINGKKINMNIFDDAKKYNPISIIEKSNIPIKIIHGTKDIIIPLKQSIKISEDNPKINLTIIEQGTHCFYDESIVKVIKETIEFLILN